MTIEENIGYHFSDHSLIERALTRKAYANEHKQQNNDCRDQEIKQKAHEKQYVLSETLEAIIGAIYLDGGFDASKKVIREWFRLEI